MKKKTVEELNKNDCIVETADKILEDLNKKFN